MVANNVKSVLFLTVHDSISVDVYPGEELVMQTIMREAMMGVIQELKARYGVDFNVPLDIDLAMGKNLMEKVKIK